MQGQQEYSERIFPGWTGHGLVAGECVCVSACVRVCVCLSFDLLCNASDITDVFFFWIKAKERFQILEMACVSDLLLD